MTSICEKFKTQLSEEGLNVLVTEPELKAHMTGCKECFEYLKAFGELERVLTDTLLEDPSEQLVSQVVQSVAALPLPRTREEKPELGLFGVLRKFSLYPHSAQLAVSIFACGILVAIFFYSGETSGGTAPSAIQSSQVEQITPGSVIVYAPLTKILQGAKLSDFAFNEIHWPRNQVPKDAILDLAEIREGYARVTLPPNMPLQRSMVASSQGSIQNAASDITEGHRVVTIPLDSTASIEGHVLPGTKVDVVLSFIDNGKFTTKVVSHDARILSFELPSFDSQGNRIAREPSVTLDVPPMEALAIHAARKLGNLSLIFPPGIESPYATPICNNAACYKSKPITCTAGRARVAGTDYIVGCDGRMERIETSKVPSEGGLPMPSLAPLLPGGATAKDREFQK